METITKVPLEYLVAALAVCFFVGLLAFVLFAGSIAAALKNIKALFEQQQAAQQIGPQPFEVKPHVPFATEAELKRVEGKVDGQSAKLDAFCDEVRRNGDTRRASIEKKVDEARRECREHTESVRLELGEKIDGMEGRIIATLKNTGAI